MTRVNDVCAAYRKEFETVVRSGLYRNFTVIAVKKGEITHDGIVNLLDEDTREQAETVGYLAMFEWYNGYKRTMYMSNQEMKLIAEKEMDPAWITDFKTMARRTIMRAILREFGVMSKEMDAVFS